jgi:hypothetical protein
MRKFKFLCALTLVFILSAGMAGATGFGVHIGYDMNTQDNYRLDGGDLFGDFGDELVNLTRGDIEKGLMGGIHFSFSMIPMIDLEFGLEGSFAKYDMNYSYLDPAEGADPITVFDDELGLARAGAYVAAKYNVISLPLLKGYVGGGVGYHVMTPLLGEDFLKEQLNPEATLDDVEYDIDIEDAVEEIMEQAGMGIHLAVGVKGKPAFIPLSVSIEYRYYMLPENDYADETNKFGSLVVGLDIGF